MTAAQAWRVMRVKIWEFGHSFAEVDKMSLNDIGDVLGYWSEKDKGNADLERERNG